MPHIISWVVTFKLCFFTLSLWRSQQCVYDVSSDISAVHINLPSLVWPLGLQTRRRTKPCHQNLTRKDTKLWRRPRSDTIKSHGEPKKVPTQLCWQRSTHLRSVSSCFGVILTYNPNQTSTFCSFSSLPQLLPAAHCQALLFSHGRLLREHIHICGFRGWQQSMLRLSSFFTPTLAQYPNWTVQSFPVSPPLLQPPSMSHPLSNNVKFHCCIQWDKSSCPLSFLSV